MNSATIEGMKIDFPMPVKFDNADLAEWLAFNLGITGSIPLSNPLIDYELSDCKIEIKKCTSNINGKEIMI
jgi:hypothetical protein